MEIPEKEWNELREKVAALEKEQLTIKKYIEEKLNDDEELVESIKGFRNEIKELLKTFNTSVYTARIAQSPQYLPYRKYTKLSKEERAGYFTFNIGDIVVKGDCQEEITGKTPNTASELLNRWKPEPYDFFYCLRKVIWNPRIVQEQHFQYPLFIFYLRIQECI